MFTGIIDHCGTILTQTALPKGCRLWIQTEFKNVVLGESIAVNGICLTVTEIKNNTFSCDISPETLAVTTANQFQLKQLVNLERALTLSSRLGGHFVSGHVDQVAKVKSIKSEADFTELVITDINDENFPLTVKKGSIAINGVSLTINKIENHDLYFMLVPHTLQRTMLSSLRESDTVNLEFDMMARIIAEQSRVYKK